MRSFFKSVFATVTGLFLFMGISLGLTGAFFVLLVASASKSVGPEVEKNTVLTIDLSLPIQDAEVEQTPGEAVQRLLADSAIEVLDLRSVTQSIEHAASDPNIVALFLDGTTGGMATGLANAAEVRRALLKFRESGKPILAYGRNWSERDLALVGLATDLAIDPLGTVELNGLSAESLFLGGAFEKYGIGVQVVRVGSYKSAVEPFTRKNFSPENREQTTTLLTDVWRTFSANLAADRQLKPDQLQAITQKQGILLAEEAKASGVVDRLAYGDEITTQLKQLSQVTEPEEDFKSIDPLTYAEAHDLKAPEDDAPEVAVVYAQGTIVDGEGGGEEIGGDRLAEQLRELRLDEDVKAVVLRVNSPGGSAVASEVIKREVALMSEQKPIVVSMGNVAASGGYWIAMAADEIVAESNTITGSIGVFGLLPNFQTLASNNGLAWDAVQTAPLANLNTVARPKTPQELALLQKFVDQIYNRFIQQVAEGRGLPIEKVKEIAQGRVWSGDAAVKLGLVDQLGGLETAIAAAAKRAKLETWTVEEYPHTKSLEEVLLESLSDVHLGRRSQMARQGAIDTEWERLQAELKILNCLNDPQQVYTWLPYRWEIE